MTYVSKETYIILAREIVAPISGSNSGIGLTVVILLTRDHGYHVIVGSRKVTVGDTVVAAVMADRYSSSFLQLDVSSDESCIADLFE